MERNRELKLHENYVGECVCVCVHVFFYRAFLFVLFFVVVVAKILTSSKMQHCYPPGPSIVAYGMQLVHFENIP